MSQYMDQWAGGPGDGIWPFTNQRRIIRNGSAATAFAAGDIVQLDMQNVGTLVTSMAPGHATSGANDSIFNVCNIPSATGILGQTVFFVCEEAIAVGATGKATLCGIVNAFVDGNAVDVLVGDALIATTAKDLKHVLGSGGGRVLAYALEGNTTTRLLKSVWFNGYGFSQDIG